MIEEVLNTLGGLFDPSRLHTVEGGRVIVEEHGKQASLKKIQIAGVGAQAVALCFDKAGHHTPFANGQSCRRACDAILFCALENEGFILCFDLKSGTPSQGDFAQLQSAHCFVDYILSILWHFHKVDCRKWQRRYFVFHDAGAGSMAKEPDRPRQHYDHPDHPWRSPRIYPIQNNGSVYLRKLLGCPL